MLHDSAHFSLFFKKPQFERSLQKNITDSEKRSNWRRFEFNVNNNGFDVNLVPLIEAKAIAP